MRMAVHQRRGVLAVLLIAAAICLSANVSLAVDAKSQLATATPTPPAGPATLAAEPAEHGLSAKAAELARPFNFPITNSMGVSWIVALGLITFAQFATRNMQPVPSGA